MTVARKHAVSGKIALEQFFNVFRRIDILPEPCYYGINNRSLTGAFCYAAIENWQL
jgi:hypothetical protein